MKEGETIEDLSSSRESEPATVKVDGGNVRSSRELSENLLRLCTAINSEKRPIQTFIIHSLQKELQKESIPLINNFLETHYHQLTTLSLINSGLRGNQLKELMQKNKGLSKCRSLQVLQLSDNALDDEAMKVLGDFLASGALPHLKELTLGGNKITSVGLNHLLNGLKNHRSKLEVLFLSGNPIGDAGVRLFVQWFKGNFTENLGKSLRLWNVVVPLHTLGLSGTGITDVGIKLLADTLRGNKTLRILHILDNPISRASFDLLSQDAISAFTLHIKRQQRLYEESKTTEQAQTFVEVGNESKAWHFFRELAAQTLNQKRLKRIIKLGNVYLDEKQYMLSIKQHLLEIQQKRLAHQRKWWTVEALQPFAPHVKVLQEMIISEHELFENIDRAVGLLTIMQLSPALKKYILMLLYPLKELHYVFHEIDPPTAKNFLTCLDQLAGALGNREFAQHYAALKQYRDLYENLQSDMHEEHQDFMKNTPPWNQALLNQLMGPQGLLAVPWQRLPRYLLLLDELKKQCEQAKKEHDYADMQGAIDTLSALIQFFKKHYSEETQPSEQSRFRNQVEQRIVHFASGEEERWEEVDLNSGYSDELLISEEGEEEEEISELGEGSSGSGQQEEEEEHPVERVGLD